MGDISMKKAVFFYCCTANGNHIDGIYVFEYKDNISYVRALEELRKNLQESNTDKDDPIYASILFTAFTLLEK